MKRWTYRFTLIISLAILFLKNMNGQAPNVVWGISLGEPFYDELNSITVDPFSGDVYTIGYFSHTIDFDPGPVAFNLTSNGNHDIFITKFNKDGLFVWAKNIGGELDDRGYQILFDPTGNGYICITGSFRGIVDFDPGEQNYIMDSSVSGGSFISKFDSDGNFIWAKAINGTVRGIVIDPIDKDIYLTGIFNDTIDCDPSNDTYYLFSEGPFNVFAVKWTESGEFVWAKQLSSSIYIAANAIAFDPIKKDVYLTGSFRSDVDFDPDPLSSFYLSAPGIRNYIFILKLNSVGSFAWAHAFGNGSGWTSSYSLVIDPGSESSIYTCGSFEGTVDFNPDSVETFNLFSPIIHPNSFILKLNGSGDFVWAKSGIAGSYLGEGFYLAIDTLGDGDLYTAGSFIGKIDFDPGPDSFMVISSNNNEVYYYDMFISKFDTEGNFEWAKTIRGPKYDYGRALCLDTSGHVYIGGNFESPSISFDNTTLFNTSLEGTPDIFISKINTTIKNLDINPYVVNIYPVPASNEIVIKLEPGDIDNTEITVINSLGEVVYDNTIAHFDYEATIDISQLIAGIYFIKLVIEGKAIVKKIIKV